MKKQNVYLSGGFRANWQESVISELGDQFAFLNPRSHKLADAAQYWTWDIHFVRNCDILFAYMDKDNPSGYGLALEVGLALALNKTIILVDERSKVDPSFENYFRIIHRSASVVLPTLADGIEYLQKFSVPQDERMPSLDPPYLKRSYP